MPTIDEIDFDRQQRIPMSFEDYLEFNPGKSFRTEWVDGIVVVTPPMRLGHEETSLAFAIALVAALPSLRVVPRRTIRVAADKTREPDIAVFEHIEEDPESLISERAPLIAVEILSTSTRSEDLFRKPGEYAAAGIQQYWIVDRKHRNVLIHTNAGGEWELLLELDDDHPTGEVVVGEHGTVRLELDVLLPRR